MKVIKRPWGEFKEFVKNKKCTVKIIEIKKNESISLQYHHKRNEMWYFLSNGFVQINNEKFKVKANELIKIKKGQMHRAIAGKKDMIFLEISFGEFAEKDIIRVEDKYGRATMKSKG